MVVLIITGVLVITLVGLFMRIRFHEDVRKAIHQTGANQASYILSEVGTPPDTLQLKSITQALSIQVRYEGPSFDWASSNDVPVFSDMEGEMTSLKGATTVWIDNLYWVMNEDGSRFLFVYDFGSTIGQHGRFLLGLILILSLILVGWHLFIRHILKPLRWLAHGIHEISEGNLEVQIPVKKRDELGRLTERFNSMTERIRQMIFDRDQLLLDISHELRSPITRMKLAMEFIPEVDKKTNLRNAISDMEIMVTEILESECLKAARGGLHRKVQNLSRILRNVADEFQGRSPGIVLKNVPEQVLLKFDAERIRTVMKNIFENGLKYSKKESKPIAVWIDDEDEVITVHIKDDGSGVPHEDLPLLFEPFYRVDRPRSRELGGYGLGLSLCKKIMDAHGGGIELFNNSDGGMTVILTFRKSTEET